MVNLELDLSKIRIEIQQIHHELFQTYQMADSQRRDTVARVIEKLRTLKSSIENMTPTITVK